MATRATMGSTTHPSGTNVLSRHRSSSGTNPSGVTSPFSPLSIHPNYVEHSRQSMSPPSSSQLVTARNSPLTATKTGNESATDVTISVRQTKCSPFRIQKVLLNIEDFKTKGRYD